VDIPSGTWTNFTDGSCQRLISIPSEGLAKRYLLGCDAVDCCIEDQDGNHKEYQIPDVHPATLTTVKSLGQETITLTPDHGAGPAETVTADKWQWSYGLHLMTTTVYTTAPAEGSTNAVLHRWATAVHSKKAQEFVNDYFQYKPVEDADLEAFRASQGYFKKPAQCMAPNTPRCADLHAEGKLTDKSLNFVRGATIGVPKVEVVV